MGQLHSTCTAPTALAHLRKLREELPQERQEPERRHRAAGSRELVV
jgi:hypothetical protein